MALPIQDDALAAEPRPSPSKRSFRYSELGLAACGVAAAALILLDIDGDVLAAGKLIVCLLLPGWAILSRLHATDPAARVVWMVGLSAVVYTSIAVVMAWTGLWNPRPAAATVLIASSAAVVFRPSNLSLTAGDSQAPWVRERRRPNGALPWLFLGAALLMWSVGLATTGHGRLDDFGLLTRLPVLWYCGVGLTVVLCVWGIVAHKMFSALLMSVSLATLVVMLYASATLLADVPRYPWTYKHIAVTNLIEATGTVTPSIDIYNRWPGFFSLSAFLGDVMGYHNAVDYAAWAETGFALMDAVLVLAIARTLSNRARIYWTAALVFSVSNWVNQNYYAPQSFAYSLYLATCLIALTFLRDAPARWAVAFEKGVRRLAMARRRQKPLTATLEPKWEQPPSAWQGWAIAGILVAFAVIVVSHQLTPYMAILGLAPLFVAGYFRARWLGPVLVIETVAFLIPNLDYIRGKYGLFSGFNIFANTGYKPPATQSIMGGEWLFTGETLAHGAILLSLLTGVLAIAGYVRRLRTGQVRTTLAVAWLAFAPALGLLAQSYGGEARFRVYLFALPWLALGVAWFFWSGPVRTRRAVAVATSSLLTMSLLFTVVNFQPEAKYRVSADDVAASQWLDANVGTDALVFDTKHFFPLLIGPHYPYYLKWGSVSSLLDYLKASDGKITVQRLQAYANHLRGAKNNYIIISDELKHWAIASNIPGGRYLSQLEGVLAKGQDAHIVYRNSTVRIYRVEGSGQGAG